MADGFGSTADFSTLNLSTNATVTLDADRTIGNLVFDDRNVTKHNWTLNAGTTGVLTLAGPSPTITCSNTSDTIGAAIAGVNGLVKAGNGTLTLSGANTYSGGTTLAAGTLAVVAGNGLGTDALNITENAAGGVSNILTVATSSAVALSNNISLPNASGTYVLTKNQTGRLTVPGTISGGGSGLVLRTTTDTAGDKATVFEFSGNNTFAGSVQLFRGVVQVDNPGSLGGATVLCDANTSPLGDLSFPVAMTFSNPLVLQTSSTISNAADVVLSGPISGNFALIKYGPGKLTLTGTNTRSGNTTNYAGTLAQATTTLASGAVLNIAAGAVAESSGTLNLNANATSPSLNAVTGAGVLRLTANNNSAGLPDIYFNANDIAGQNSTANYGTKISTTVDLGTTQRFIYGLTDHNGVGKYAASSGADCTFVGAITNTGGLTFIAQDNYTGSNPMECPFLLAGTNTFTGPVEIQRGSVYLGSVGALTNGNVLRFNPAAGNNARFLLYGNNAAVSDLQSLGAGTSLIADGNLNPGNVGPATLTITQNNPNTFAGTITDFQSEYNATAGLTLTPTLSLVKSGAAALTLSGTLNYSGTTTVKAGKLYINTTAGGGGLVTVASGATLGGSGLIASTVIVSNNATLEPGSGIGSGTLTLKNLVLGVNGTEAVAITCGANPAGLTGMLSVTNANGLTNIGSVTINVTGSLPSATPATYTIITYSGAVKGSGTFAVGTLPNLALGYVTNNAAASAIQLVVTSVTIPSVTWVGSPANRWDLLGSNVWVQTGTATPASYADGNQVVFDDTAVNFSVNLAAAVSPNVVVVSNAVNDYAFTGAGGISGYGLTKQGGGTLLLATSNSYVGNTTIAAGKVVLGAATAIPGGAGKGNITINGSVDLGGFSPTFNNLAGSGMVDNASAGGATVLNLFNSGTSTFSGAVQNTTGSLELDKNGSGTLSLAGTNTYSGPTVINGGTLQIGAGGVTGALGGGPVFDNATLAFNRSDTNTIFNDINGSGGIQQNGSGMLTLQGNLSYTGPTTVNAGMLALPKDATFDTTTGTTLNIAAGAVARISGTVVNLNVNASSVATDVTGAGTLQLASTLNAIESYSDLNFGPNHVATADYGCRLGCNLDLGSVHRTIWGWSGRNDVMRYLLTGCDCQFAGTISGSAELTLIGQNSFSPGVNTMEVPFAFNGSNTFTGALEIRRGSLYLGNANALNHGNVLILDPAANVSSRVFLYGFNASVSDLQSTTYGSALIADGNNSTTTNVGPATLTVTENNPTTFGGSIVDWFAEYVAATAGSQTPKISLVKNGSAALTLTGTNTYSGTTVINSGKLFFNGSSTGGGAVTVNTNATLAGSGIVNSAVTVGNGGAIETGNGSGSGSFLLKALTLGNAGGDLATLNLTTSASLNVTNNNGLLLNGGANSITVNVGGSVGALGQYPLITYKGALGGAGFPAFQLGALPPGVSGYLSNNTANVSVDLVVTAVTIPRWTGSLSPEWSASTLSAPKNWVLDADGVTEIDYVDGEAVRFDDSAMSTTVSLNIANVAPFSVTVSNVNQNYSIGGSFGITGVAALTKEGSGILTLGANNTYTGNTTLAAGTLQLASAFAIPGGAGFGNLMVNGTLDLAGFSATVNNLSGNGIVDDLTGGGAPVLNIVNTGSNNFSGAIRNTSGVPTVNLTGSGIWTFSGTNSANGAMTVSGATLNLTGKIGAGGAAIASGGGLSGTGGVTGPTTLADGSALLLTANNPLTVGALALNGKISVTVAGTISTNAPGIYTLLNYGSRSGSGSYALVQIPGLFSSGLSAQLVETNNQLELVIQAAALTGTIADVKHVVVFMQENRAFDHYFGTLHGVHGFNDRNVMILTNGRSIFYQPNGANYVLPFHTTSPCITDTDHSWGATHNAIDNGRNDAWPANKTTETMCYYNRSDLPYYYSLADAYTILDDYHCSVLASTDPNRVALMTGMIDPTGMGAATIAGTTYPGGPLIDNTEPSAGWGPGWVTYPELLAKAGVSWKIYQTTGDNYDDNALAWFAAYKKATAGNVLYDSGMAGSTNVVTQFQSDVTSNTLPAVSWIIGPYSGSEHPPASPQSGEALTKQFLDALASNPKVYSNTVFILCYDENDGFFDHAQPVTPPAGATNEFVSGAPIGLGIRVPAIIISPWTRGGRVCSQVFDHTSIIRFIETWTGVREPNISSWRRQVVGDLTSAFDFAHPVYDYPSLPATAPVSVASVTPAPPGQQTVPVQEAGTLTPLPLPYQPNALPVLNLNASNISLVMNNSGAASVHFLVVPNAYRTDNPTPYDVLNNYSATNIFSTASTGGKYDLSCYGPNGFQRRFAGNLSADGNQIEAAGWLNPSTGGLEVTLANATASPVTFTVTNGYVANGQTNYTVPANTTNVVSAGSETNNGFYDLTVTASADNLFLRRFLGRVETNGVSSTITSSHNPSSYGQNVTFTTSFTGFSVPTGTVQFYTNGTALNSPVNLAGGTATLNTTNLLPGTNLVLAVYAGDLLNGAATNLLTQVVTNLPITVAIQIANATNECGSTVTLNAVATGSAPFTYQWYDFAAQPLVGATNSTLTLAQISTAQSGSYLVVVRSGGSAATNAIWLTVIDTTPPLVVLNGNNPMTNWLGTAFVDPGAIASDTCAGLLPVITNGFVADALPGTYFIQYIAADAANNSTTNTRTVYVMAPLPPVVSGGVIANGGDFNLTFSGPAGQPYRIVMSSDLSQPVESWQAVASGVFGSAPVIFVDTNVVNQTRRFYQVVSP